MQGENFKGCGPVEFLLEKFPGLKSRKSSGFLGRRPSPRFRGDSDPDDMSGERQRGKAPMESEAEAERKF